MATEYGLARGTLTQTAFNAQPNYLLSNWQALAGAGANMVTADTESIIERSERRVVISSDDIKDKLLRARKLGETPDYATIGKDPNTPDNPFDAQDDTGELNVVYATINNNPDPQIVYYDPSFDMRLLQWGTRVELEWRSGKAWIKGADKEYLTNQQAGIPLPTSALPVPEHDHTNDDEGGALGADTVDTTQLVDSAVETAKINDLAVTTGKLADNAVTTVKITDLNVTTGKLADNAVTTVKITDANVTTAKINDSAVTTAKINNNAVTTAKINNLTSTSNHILFANGSNGMRAGYRFASATNTTNVTNNSATPSVIWSETLNVTLLNTSTAGIDLNTMTSIKGDTVGDSFALAYQYNYNNAGVEAWGDIVVFAWDVPVANYFFLQSLDVLFSAGGVSWGFSSTYKLRLVIARSGGTGTATVFTSSFRTTEKLIEV